MINHRAQGATALICPSDLKPPKADREDGKIDPYGWDNSNEEFDRTHVIADKFGGDQIAENIFIGYSRMNKSGMARCESKIKKQLRAGNWVYYTGTLNYSGGKAMPDSITMTAYTKDEVLFQNVTVLNNSQWQTTC